MRKPKATCGCGAKVHPSLMGCLRVTPYRELNLYPMCPTCRMAAIRRFQAQVDTDKAEVEVRFESRGGLDTRWGLLLKPGGFNPLLIMADLACTVNPQSEGFRTLLHAITYLSTHK